MGTPERVVVVGGGVSGFGVVADLRRRGYSGRLTFVEPQGLPYDRPPLSKGYLDGTLPADRLLLAPESWLAENAVDLIVDAAVRLDASAARVELAGGGVLDADSVVLAMGGRARTLPVPGGDAEGLLYLRTRADADRLRPALASGRRLAIVGAGLIGAEVAATASGLGVDVTLIDPAEIPGEHAFGRLIGRQLHDMHAAHGVRTVRGTTTAIRRTASEWVVSVDAPDASGVQVAADAVLIAVGIVPELGLAAASGLDVDGGILVDVDQRTANPSVFAVGDGARLGRHAGPPRPRHEHWDSALRSGQRAAAALLGQGRPPDAAPWLWSDRYGVHAESAGVLGGRPIVRERDGRPWVVFYSDDDRRLVGAASIDGGAAIKAARRIIALGLHLDPSWLEDPSNDLRALANSRPRGRQ